MSNPQWFLPKSVVQRVLIFLLLLAFFNLFQPKQAAYSMPNATFTVNSSGDLPDADLDNPDCDTDLDDTNGLQCTLRAAIQQANVPNSGHDTILFSGFRFITLDSELPALTHVNGTTIYNATADQVWLSGANLSGSDGLTLTSNNNKVMGLVIVGFDNGIVVNGDNNVIGTDGDGADDATERNVIYSNDDGTGYGIQLAGNYNVVAGNIIGLQPDGSSIGTNTTGIWVSGNYNRIGTDGDGTADTTERNIISGNSGHGIDISGDYTVVAGNYIGTNETGDTAKPNGSNGIDIDPLASNTLIGTDSDGVGDTGERNIISGNGGDGVHTKGDNVTIAGNYIGTNATGSSAIPNGGFGVAVNNGANETIIGTNGDGTLDSIERNTISGNTAGGLEITGDIQDTKIAGNKIGTDPAGTTALANQGDGILADGIGDLLVIGTNSDGSGDVNERNIISGNKGNGVHLGTGLSAAVVAGNYIGVNHMGNGAISNGANGVLVDGGANANLIGSDADGVFDTRERNLISGNGASGVRIEGDGSDLNQVTGNYIGVNASGNGALANNIGVWVDDQAANTLIGADLKPDLGNVISGNTNDGIFIGSDCDTTSVWHNLIGVNYLRTTSIPNGRNGIYLTAGAFDSDINGNTIANNAAAGIYMTPTAGSGNYHHGNRIYDNAGLGVDLAPAGVNPNDHGDADSGPNDLMNYPVFTRLVTDGDNMLIEGLLDSEPDTHFDIDLIAVEDCDPSGYGESSIDLAWSTGVGTTTGSNGIGVFAYDVGGYSSDRSYMVMSTGYSEFSECKLIEFDQDPYMAQLSIADASVEEGDSGSSWMDFDVTLNRTATITVSVAYDIYNVSALDGQDYNRSTGEIAFPPGSTQQTISVEILGDTIEEPHETFTVNLDDPVGAQVQDGQATGTILNDDGLAQLSIADASASEGDSGSSWMDFDITLSRTSATAVTVDYDMSDGSAQDGLDYQQSAGTVTFSPGTAHQTISVEILGDTSEEPDETFTVNLHTPVGAQIQDAQATGTILDDDGIAQLSIADASMDEGDSGSSWMDFDVTLNRTVTTAVSVQYDMTDGSAQDGLDYHQSTGEITFPPGTAQQTIQVEILGDTSEEPHETFTVNLHTPVGAQIQDAQATGTILNDDGGVGYDLFLPMVIR